MLFYLPAYTMLQEFNSGFSWLGAHFNSYEVAWELLKICYLLSHVLYDSGSKSKPQTVTLYVPMSFWHNVFLFSYASTYTTKYHHGDLKMGVNLKKNLNL